MRRLNPHRDYLQIMSSVYIFWNVKGEFPVCTIFPQCLSIIEFGCIRKSNHFRIHDHLLDRISKLLNNTIHLQVTRYWKYLYKNNVYFDTDHCHRCLWTGHRIPPFFNFFFFFPFPWLRNTFVYLK